MSAATTTEALFAHRILTATEEQECGDAIRQGRVAEEKLKGSRGATRVRLQREIEAGRQAREKLVSHNIRLVGKFIGGAGIERGSADFEEALQDGLEGLMRAVDGFDSRRGYRFSTYAGWWITKYLREGKRQRASSLAMRSETGSEQLRDLAEAEETLTAALHRAPSVGELAEELQLKAPVIETLRTSGGRPAVLEEAIFDEEPAGEVLLEAQAITAIYAEQLFAQLSDLERRVVRMRLGFGGREYTLAEIGKELGLKAHDVGEIFESAIDGLRTSSVGVALSSEADGLDGAAASDTAGSAQPGFAVSEREEELASKAEELDGPGRSSVYRAAAATGATPTRVMTSIWRARANDSESDGR